MSGRSMSQKAAAVAVIVAFLVGIVGSLAIRGASQGSATSASTTTSRNTKQLHWRLPVAFQTTLPVLGDNPLYVTKIIADMTADRMRIDVFEPGELMPAFAIVDAVRDNKVPAGYTWLGYDQGKIPASALIGAVPFGMEPWEFTAWWYESGGQALGEALYKPHNVHPILCGMTGPETAGWFRTRIESLDDVQGLKIRFAGLGGKVMEKLGASVTMLPGGEIFQALEKGAIDASEFALPIVDQTLGFNRVAKYNYYPGWHQPATSSHMVINLDHWNAMSSADQKVIEAACTAGVIRNLSRSEALQGEIIANFPKLGVSAESLPDELLRELERISTEVLDEEASKDGQFAKILASQRTFRENYAHWKKRAYLPRDF